MSMLTTLINRKGCLEEVQIDFVARTLTISLAVLSHSLICARACQGKFDRAIRISIPGNLRSPTLNLGRGRFFILVHRILKGC